MENKVERGRFHCILWECRDCISCQNDTISGGQSKHVIILSHILFSEWCGVIFFPFSLNSDTWGASSFDSAKSWKAIAQVWVEEPDSYLCRIFAGLKPILISSSASLWEERIDAHWHPSLAGPLWSKKQKAKALFVMEIRGKVVW